jgi:acylphosphatase
MKRLDVVVSGRVQGVCFRMETRDVAQALDLRGIVENRPDGTVHVIAEGGETALQRLLDFCRKGPPLSRVTAVKVTWAEATGEFGGFSIRH